MTIQLNTKKPLLLDETPSIPQWNKDLQTLVGKTLRNYQNYEITFTKDLTGRVVCNCKKGNIIGENIPLWVAKNMEGKNLDHLSSAEVMFNGEAFILGRYGLKGGGGIYSKVCGNSKFINSIEAMNVSGSGNIGVNFGDIINKHYGGKLTNQEDVNDYFKALGKAFPTEILNINIKLFEELTAQYVECTEEVEKIDQFLETEKNGALLCTGSAGVGKSSLLKMTTIKKWKEYADNPKDNYICLFMHLPACRDLKTLLANMKIDKNTFDTFIKDKKLVIFLDSYDEIYPHPTINKENYCKNIYEEITHDGKVKFVVACRDHYLEKLSIAEENQIFSIQGTEKAKITRSVLGRLLPKSKDRKVVDKFLEKKIKFCKEKRKNEDIAVLESPDKYTELFETIGLYDYINTFFMLNIVSEILPSLKEENLGKNEELSKLKLVDSYVDHYIEREWKKPGVQGNLEGKDYYKTHHETLNNLNKNDYFKSIGKELTKEVLFYQLLQDENQKNQACLVYHEESNDKKNSFWENTFETKSEKRFLQDQPFYGLLQCLPLKIRDGVQKETKEIDFTHDLIKSYYLTKLFKDYLENNKEAELKELLGSHLFTKETLGMMVSLKEEEVSFDLVETLKNNAEWGTNIKNNGWALKQYNPEKMEALDRAVTKLKPMELATEMTFGAQEWQSHFGYTVENINKPENIEKILSSNCPYWPGKKVQDTHLLILVPKGLSLSELGELAKKANTKYSYFDVREHAETKEEKSYWALITKDVIPESRCLVIKAQEKMLTSEYKIPKAIEVVIGAFTHYARHKEYLYMDDQEKEKLVGKDAYTYTRCEELVDGKYRVVVGGFGSSGLDCSGDFDVGGNTIEISGVVGARKFF